MSFISEITLINQNQHIPSVIASDLIAREALSKEIQKLNAKEKEEEIEKVTEVEGIEKILPDEDNKAQIEKEAKRHIDIKI